MTDNDYTDGERLELIRLMDRLYQSERHLGARDVVDVLILRTIAMGKLEGRPLDVSSLAYYLGLSRQTVGRRIKGLVEQGAVEVREKGRRHELFTSQATRQRSLGNMDRNIDEIRRFAKQFEDDT